MQMSNMKLAKRKLNIIGIMVFHCSVITSNETLRRAKEDCSLAASYEKIIERQKKFKSLKDGKKKEEIMVHVSNTISKLRGDSCDSTKFFKPELSAIPLSVFRVMEDLDTSKKPDLLEKIESKLNDDKGRFESKTSRILPPAFHNNTSDMQYSTIATNVSTTKYSYSVTQDMSSTKNISI